MPILLKLWLLYLPSKFIITILGFVYCAVCINLYKLVYYFPISYGIWLWLYLRNVDMGIINGCINKFNRYVLGCAINNIVLFLPFNISHINLCTYTIN